MNKNNLPNNLYELRKGSNLSQEDFAEKLGVSRQAVSKWERGEAYPDTENLIAISEMFSVTIDEMLRSDFSGTAHVGESIADKESDVDNSGFGCSLVIEDGISFKAEKGNREDFGDECADDGDEDENSEKESFPRALPYPILTTVVFLAIGFIFDGWWWAWTLFLTIPIYYSLVEAIQKRSLSDFAYPVLVTFVFCLVGMLFGIWHPAWIIFITVPIYYTIAETIDRRKKNNLH